MIKLNKKFIAILLGILSVSSFSNIYGTICKGCGEEISNGQYCRVCLVQNIPCPYPHCQNLSSMAQIKKNIIEDRSSPCTLCHVHWEQRYTLCKNCFKSPFIPGNPDKLCAACLSNCSICHKHLKSPPHKLCKFCFIWSTDHDESIY